MPVKRSFTERQLKTIQMLHDEKYPISHIASRFSVSQGTIVRVLREMKEAREKSVDARH